MQNLRSWALRGHICGNCRRKCLRKLLHNGTGSRRTQHLYYHNVVNRRPTTIPTAPTTATAIRSGRRKAGAAEIFTAFYTAIMATAAVADSSYKELRRKDLDQQLNRARQDLERVLQESSAADANLALRLVGPPGGTTADASSGILDATTTNIVSRYQVVEGIKSICVPFSELQKHAADKKEREAYLTWIHTQFGLRRRWWTKPLAPNEGLDDIEAYLLAEEQTSVEDQRRQEEEQHLRRYYQDEVDEKRRQIHEPSGALKQREPKTSVQFRKMTEATSELVDALLIEAYRLAHPDDAAAQKASMEDLDSAWTAIRLLRSEGYPRYQVPDLDPAATLEARLQVNAATRRIFQHWQDELSEDTAPIPPSPFPSLSSLSYLGFGGKTKKEKKKKPSTPPAPWYERRTNIWVARLCYNLLVSSAPPGILNYNALLFGFTAVGRHSLAHLVANSFLHRTHLQPTQQTLICLLHHYRAQGNVLGFYRLLWRLVGMDNRGAKIRRRHLDAVAATSEERRWARRHDVALTNGYVVQRAAIDVPVLDAILTGLLSLGQVRHAAVVFAAFLADCGRRVLTVDLSANMLSQFIKRVLDAVDVPGARALLSALVENAELIVPLVVAEEQRAWNLAVQIRQLLSVASVREPLQSRQQSSLAGVEQENASSSHAFRSNSHIGPSRLARALFVADVQQYLVRLRRILAATRRALATDPSSFANEAPSWTIQLVHLRELPDRLDRKHHLYRRMAHLKTVDDTASAVFAACAHVLESFLRTVTATAGEAAAETKAAAAEVADEAMVDGSEVAINEAAEMLSEAHTAVVEGTKSTELGPANALPDPYRAFLRRGSVPFPIRFTSYLQVVAPSKLAAVEASPKEEEPATPDNHPAIQVASLLEHHITVDIPAVGDLLQDNLREILLHSLLLLQPQPSESEKGANVVSFAALKETARRVSLLTLMSARASVAQPNFVPAADGKQRRQQQALGDGDMRRPMDFVSLPPYGLRLGTPKTALSSG